MKNIKNKATNQSSSQEQSDKFIEAANELGCDMTQEDFAKTLKKLSTVPPMTNEEVKKKAKKKK